MARHVYNILCHGESDVGRVRTLNEDRFLAKPESGVFAVADGMGGHDAGEMASASIVEHLASIGRPSSALDLRARVEDRVAAANAEIRRLAEERGKGSIGSTLAALLVFEFQFAAMWSGDSRVYRLRGNVFEQLTHDHTEVQQLVDRGVLSPEDALTYPRRNVILHAVGIDEEAFLDIAAGTIEPGDTFLLCSDGLTGHASDREIGEALLGASPQEAAEQLIGLTLERGASDNVTVVVARFEMPANGDGELAGETA